MERVAREAAAQPVAHIVCKECGGLVVGYGEKGRACVQCGQLERTA